MAQDIRKMFRNNKSEPPCKIPQGHRERFSKLLDENLHPEEKRTTSSIWWKVAAAILVLVAVGIGVFNKENQTIENTPIVDTEEQEKNNAAQMTLGDLSPELKKVETYYVANINLELADIDLDEANKKLLDGYLGQLGELNDAYKELTAELNEVGPNDQTINALINNLQLRLQLLYQLKEKIKELKETKNEEFTTQTL